MKLRAYQEKAVVDILAGFKEYDRQLAVMPTGAGKTIVFSKLAEAKQPRRSLILAHREELIEQAVDKIAKSTGIFSQVEKAEQRASLMSPVVVASIQTLIGAQRRERWPKDHFGLVVVDEAHHALADSYQKVLQHFTGAKVLGVTATPDRGDKRNLGQYFENIAFEITMFDLIKQGYLSPVKVKALPVEIDLAQVKSVAGDYSADDLGTALTPYLRSIAQALRDHAAFRKCLVFLPLIATSKTFTEICQQEGLLAYHVDGISADRKEILAGFAAGQFDILCNAMLLTEGFDDPSIDCVVVLRPTRSRALYAQMVGRGTRVCPTKDDLLVLDFLWLHEKHNLVRPAHLVASTEEIADAITEKLENEAKGGGQGELDLELLNTAAIAEREERLQEELRKQANRKARTIDAMEFCLSLHEVETADYEPTCKWEAGPVTDGQANKLAQYRIGLDTVKCKGHASKIIDMLLSRSRQNLATPSQLKYLRRLGHPSPDTATFQEATAFLDKRFNKQKHERSHAE
jgi:superfamily II DNA or RNA helicase